MGVALTGRPSLPRRTPRISKGGLGGQVVWQLRNPSDQDPTGKWLTYAEGESVLMRLLADWGRSPRVVATNQFPVRNFVWHPDGDRIAVLDRGGDVRVWRTSPETIDLETRYEGLGLSVGNMGYDPTGRWLATAGGHEGVPTVRLQDTRAGPEARPLIVSTSLHPFVNDLDFAPGGEWLVTENVEAALFWPIRRQFPVVLQGHAAEVEDVAFSPDGKTLFSASGDGTVRAWPLAASRPATHTTLYSGSLSSPDLDIDPTGNQIVVSVRGGVAFVPIRGGPSRLLEGFLPQSSILSFAFSAGGRMIAVAPFRTSAAADSGIRVWNIETRESRLLRLQDSPGKSSEFSVGGIAFLPDGRLLASIVAKETNLLIVDAITGSTELVASGLSECKLLPAGRSAVCAFVPDEKNRRRRKLAVIDLHTRKTSVVANHGDSVLRRAVDSTGTIVATGSFDGTVRVGRLTGEEPHLLLGHVSQIRAVEISPDGRWIATAGLDKTVRLWPMPDLSKPPFHTLPHAELLAKLRSLTNLRVVEDTSSSTGYKLNVAPFPGWEHVPEW